MFTFLKNKSQSSTIAIASVLGGQGRRLKRFTENEDGVMTYFGLFMLLMMLLVGGIGVDLMRNELERSKMQATLDRAILAAADMEQVLDPQDVVKDYFKKAGLDEYLTLPVKVTEGINFRRVSADGRAKSPTRFMKFVGVDELPISAVGTAEERVTNVEISVVLDISGSMGWNNKMANLQAAGVQFVDAVMQDDSRDLISMSLIPYTAQVNAGEDIFSNLNANQLHGFSYCIDFDQADFSTTTISKSKQYEHMQHFEAGSNWAYPIQNPGCPQQSFEEIVAFTQNKQKLKDTINDYTARANTAIHLGMKWGVAMLDPSFGSITVDLAGKGKADPVFSSRPAAYTDDDTLKTVILMTDGQNVDTIRIQPWYYAQESHYVHWSRYPLYWYLNNYVYGNWNNWRYTKYSAAQADGMLDSICDAAKAKGIVIWSIGFEVTDYSATVMRDCASSPSHFFRVEGVEISDAFESIAKQINQLRLTQ